MFTLKIILVALLTAVTAIPTWIYPGPDINDTVAIPHNDTAELYGELPASFSWRNNPCRSPIQNQGGCGSCWAFTASGAMNDRFCIASGGKEIVRLSPQYAVTCSKTCVSGVCNKGCAYGQFAAYITYMNQHGIPSETCVPYNPYRVDQCPTSCKDGSQMYLYRSGPYYMDYGVNNMMRDIVAHGPIMVQYQVYSDFGTCNTDHVYSKSSGARFLYNHALIITGFGTLNGVPYWEIANSYGDRWGDGGYCYIRRGTNECRIESFPVGAIPTLGGPSSGGSGGGTVTPPKETTTTITSPSAPTTVDIGSVITVAWTSTSTEHVKIAIGNDVIATDQPASGRLSFMIPSSLSPGKYPLTISNDKTATVELTLVSTSVTTPNFISPTQGQTFKSGGSVPVKVPATSGESYSISLCTSTSNCPYKLASGIATTDPYLTTSVTLPKTISGTYMLQFLTNKDMFYSPTFSVLAAPSLDINTPPTSKAGSYLDITWSVGTAPYCNLYLLQNGNSIKTIVQDTEDDGFFTWMLPTDLSGGYSIKIQCGTDTDVTAIFQVNPSDGESGNNDNPGSSDYKLAYVLPLPTLTVGQASTIAWTCTGNCPATIPVSYTQGSHTFPITTATNKVGTNSIKFTPSTAGDIYINIGEGNYIRVAGRLTVHDAGAASITFNKPTAGTKVTKGSMIYVAFTPNGVNPPYTLTLIQGGTKTRLATSSYSSVAAEIPNISAVKDGDATIEVSAQGVTATSATFTIVSATTPGGDGGDTGSGTGDENTGGALVVNAPKMGQKVYGGTPFTVQWNGGNGPYTIALYQASNGHFFQTFGTEYTGTNAEVTIPKSILSNNYFITVSETNNPKIAVSSYSFVFSSTGGDSGSTGGDDNTPSTPGDSTGLTVTSPPTGSAYNVNSKLTLAWKCTPNCNALGNINIEMVDTNFDNGQPIYDGPNYGFYAFNVPSVPSGNYMFIMKTKDVKIYSPTYKIINPASGSGNTGGGSGSTGGGSGSTGKGSVTFNAPTSGDKVPPGTSFILKWTSSGLPNTIDIYISGPTTKEIMTNAPNSGYLKVTIPSGIPEGTYSIVFKDADGNEYKSPGFAI